MIQKTILIICTNSDRAGAPIHVLTLLTLLRDQFHFIVIFGEDGPIAEQLREMDIDVRIVPQMRSALSPVKDLAAYRLIKNIAHQTKPSLIHCHSTKAGMLGRLVSRSASIPCIYTIHGWGWRGMGRFKGSVIYMVERLMRVINRKAFYIYVSKSVETAARDLLKLPPAAGVVVYNGVPDSVFSPAVKRNITRVLMVARVDESKDHETLLKAFEYIGAASELWLCGQGTDSREFKAQAQQWAPDRYSSIRFLGVRKDVDALLKDADIFALISNYEALPLSIIEAMSAGKVIVATGVGGVHELVSDFETGFLVEKNDATAVAKAIESATDFEIRKHLGQASREKYLQSFKDTQMAAKVSKLYHKFSDNY